MLVLERRKGETISIDRESEVVVMEIKQGYVKLGIAAPKSVSVYRGEIYERIQAEAIDMAEKTVGG